MAKMTHRPWAPRNRSKKTSIGEGRHTKYKNIGSAAAPAKGYKKKYRGQGKGK